MKKSSISLLVLLALVFSGCTTNTKKKKSSKEGASVSQTSENPTSSQTSESGTSVNPTSVTPGTEFTVTVETSGSKFVNETGYKGDGGIELDSSNLSEADEIETLRSYLDTNCGVTGCVSSLICTSVYIQPITRGGSTSLTVTLGTKKRSASLTINSSFDIVKVEAMCSPYFNYYESQGEGQWVFDDNAEVYINGERNVLTKPATEAEPESQKVSYTPASPVEQIVLSNGGDSLTPNRIYIESLTITFKR